MVAVALPAHDQTNICLITGMSPETTQSQSKPGQTIFYKFVIVWCGGCSLGTQMLLHTVGFNLSTYKGFEQVQVQANPANKKIMENFKAL